MSEIFIKRRFKKRDSSNLRREVLNRANGLTRKFSTAIIGRVSTGRHSFLHRLRKLINPNLEVTESIDSRDVQMLFADLSSRPEFHPPRARIVVYVVSLLEERDKYGYRHFRDIFRNEVFCTLKNFIILYDVGSRLSFEEVDDIVKEMNLIMDPCLCRFILVGNKIDDTGKRLISRNEGVECSSACCARKYFECSALKSLNIEPVLDYVLSTGLRRHSSRR